LSSPAKYESMRRRRRLAAAGLAASAFALLAVSAALPSLAATTPKKGASAASALSTTVTKTLAAPGPYTVVVTVAGPATPETVTVSVGSSTQRDVSLTPGESTALAFYSHFNRRSFKVHAVASAAPVHLAVAASRRGPQKIPAVPAAPIGSSGALGSTASPGITYTAPAKGPYTHLVWADEFNGPAGTPPNPAVWTPDLGGDCGAGTLSQDTTDPANASLDGSGDMGINAFANATTPGAPTYTAAQLDSNHKLSFSYGELEARILLPTGSGLCSGFWMVGDSANGGCFPQCGEIDVMEAVTKFPDSITGTLHGPVSGSSNYQQFQSAVNAPTPFSGAFHTYGVIWQPGRITWTLDGVPYGTATPSQLPKSAQWVFDGDPFHLLLSLDVGGWTGPPDAGATFPATMRVDWVRVYD
jgi:beta-glucanase (GH16 family)